jgi:hypothetical protein
MLGLLLLVGVVELLFPRRLVDLSMRYLVEEEDVTVRPWAYALVRFEGFVVVLWVVRRRRRRTAAGPERLA